MLTPLDDYPIHQTALPIAHPASGDPNHYDRYWFNGYREDFYFAVGMAVYPNRGIIDAAFSTVHDGVQRSVFASSRMPADRTQTRVGPLSIEIVEPLRVTRVRVDAADLGIDADVTFTARTVALEEPRQTMMERHAADDGLDAADAVGQVVGRDHHGRRRDRDRPDCTAPRTGRGAFGPSAQPAGAAPDPNAAADLLPLGADQLRGSAARTSSASSARTATASSAARPCST